VLHNFICRSDPINNRCIVPMHMWPFFTINVFALYRNALPMELPGRKYLRTFCVFVSFEGNNVATCNTEDDNEKWYTCFTILLSLIFLLQLTCVYLAFSGVPSSLREWKKGRRCCQSNHVALFWFLSQIQKN
jgi:hypothetical protein